MKAALHKDPKMAFQTAANIRDISRFLKKAHEKRFPDSLKHEKKKNRSTQTTDTLFGVGRDCD